MKVTDLSLKYAHLWGYDLLLS